MAPKYALIKTHWLWK